MGNLAYRMAARDFDGARRFAVVVDHLNKKGEPKLLKRCTMPLTGVGCVMRVYTSPAVIDIEAGHFVLREKLPALAVDDLWAVTGAELKTADGIADPVVTAL